MRDARHRAAPAIHPVPGAIVHNEHGAECVILSITSEMKVIVREVGSGEHATLELHEIGFREIFRSSKKVEVARNVSFAGVTEHDWKIAERRREILAPLCAQRRTSRAQREEACAELEGVSQATLYRMINDLRRTQLLSSLLPSHPSGGKGKSRMLELEHWIQSGINEYYLTGQKLSKAETIRKIAEDFREGKEKPPAENTIRHRLCAVDARKAAKARHGSAAARRHDPHQPRHNKLRDVTYPLQVTQIDHTMIDVMVVDDVHRKPIARPWITVLLDVFSRVVLGFYISLDPPSSMSAGLCITHGILPKAGWLEELGLKGKVKWPFFGIMDVLHMDNAKEFRGKTLEFGCNQHNIHAHFRPVKNPKYGAHIERFMGTLASKMKSIPGATFSNSREKGEYDPEKTAEKTLAELEKWLVVTFAEYHSTKHTGIDMKPEQRYHDGIFGTSTTPPRGVPSFPSDAAQLQLDFMPYFERVIQPGGVVIDGIWYFDDCFRRYINVKDSKTKSGIFYQFRRNPHDISVIYFQDPFSGRHVEVGYADARLPPGISLWEYKVARRQMKENGTGIEDTKSVMALVIERRKIDQEASEKTKVARKQVQRRKEHAKAREKNVVARPESVRKSGPPDVIAGYNPDEIEAFE